jgi:hypothetical protein
MPTFPWWWSWELSFTRHMKRRMPERRVTELDLRAMLERGSRLEPSDTAGRFLVHTRHAGRPWIVVVEPEADTRLLAVITAYEVSK